MCRCGLFHSAYSNSYVNLVINKFIPLLSSLFLSFSFSFLIINALMHKAIFKPDTERNVVQECVGLEGEELVSR